MICEQSWISSYVYCCRVSVEWSGGVDGGWGNGEVANIGYTESLLTQSTLLRILC